MLVLTLAWPSGPATTTVALVGLPKVHATARLTAEPWGTAMDLRESGQPSGEVLSVYVRTVSGSWWQTGTYRTVGLVGAGHHGLRAQDVEDQERLDTRELGARRHARVPRPDAQRARPELTPVGRRRGASPTIPIVASDAGS